MLDSAKRLQLLVRGDGRILTFKADPAVLTQAFGQDAATLNQKVGSSGRAGREGGMRVRIGWTRSQVPGSMRADCCARCASCSRCP